jgi:hypothetical protein
MARRRMLPCLIALAIPFGVPATAQAKKIVYGSDLTAPADIVEAHGADSAFWNVSLGNGGSTAAPFGGQVVSVRVKGIVIPDPTGFRKPTTMFHFQTLRPLPDREMAVWLSSGAFYTPLGGDSQQINTYHPVNMCVHKGDYLDFNDIGGNEWWWGNYSGMPFQTFSRVPGSATNFYTKNAGTNIGSQWRPMMTKQGEELLMQMTLATGPDATWICPGGYSQHIHRGVFFRRQVQLSGNDAMVRVTCPWPTYGTCHGSITGTAKVHGRQVRFGKGHFTALHGWSTNVYVPLPSAAVKAAAHGGLRALFTAVSHDDPRHDSRDHWPSQTPVQTRTNDVTLTVSP